MCPEALIEDVEHITKIFKSDRFPDFYIRTAYRSDDAQLMQLGLVEIDCGGFKLHFQRHPSYLAFSQLQHNRSETKVIVLAKQPTLIVGILNIGWKYCYIDGQPDLIRCISDLKVRPEYRGRGLIHFMMQFMQETLSPNTVLQSVVANQHQQLQRNLYQQKLGFAAVEIYDDVYFFNLSHIHQPKQYAWFHFEVLNEKTVPLANAFIASMNIYYNFLPSYDLSALASGGHPFWGGLKLSDFYLMYNKSNQIVGLYGIWDQSAFKQAKIFYYKFPLKVFRLVLNSLAGMTKRMTLPKPDRVIDYVYLHSVLCKPDYLDVFAGLLFHAQQQIAQRRKVSYSFALAKNDPRIQALKGAVYYRISAKHALHRFGLQAESCFDREKISYFELSRL